MPTIRVRIYDRDFLEDRAGQQPTINDDMLDMAGKVFEVEKYITSEGWYRFNGWVWNKDWIDILEDNESLTRYLELPPITRYDISDFLDTLRLQNMPDELEYIAVAGFEMIPYECVINNYHFRLEKRAETGFYVKFKGSVEYNISPYFTRYRFGDTPLTQLRDRINEHLVVIVVKALANAAFDFGQVAITKQLFRTNDALYLTSQNQSIFGSSNSFPVNYEIWKYASLSTIYNLLRKARQVSSLEVPVYNYDIVSFYKLVDREDAVIIGESSSLIHYMKISDLEANFPYITYKKDDLFGFYYATIKEPVDMFLYAGFPDVGSERVLKMPYYDTEIYEELVSIVEDSNHRLTKYPRGYIIGYRWYDKNTYEYEKSKYDKLKAFNIESKGDKFVHTPTGRTIYNDTSVDDVIQEYDYEADINFFGEPSDLHLGVELEVDKGGEDHFNAALIMLPLGWKHAYVMHDGSLNNGFEIATMPMTLSYAESIRSNFADMVGIASKLGYHSHNTSTCGLHVHFDRHFLGSSRTTQNIKAGYLALIMERNWEKFVQFSRRNYDRIDQWAAKKDLITNVYADDTDNDLRDKFVDKYVQGDKYVALNTCHSHTFELRIFRGTLKLETLFATMQFVDNLVRVAKECPSLAKAQQITFADIINYNPHKDLVDYVDTRGILTRNYIEYRGE